MLLFTLAGNIRQAAFPQEAMQVAAVVVGSCLGTIVAGLVKQRTIAQMFSERLAGVLITMGLGIGVGCVVVATLILREKHSRDQARFHRGESERHRLEKNLLEAKLQLMQAQVEPHFLFNTLANVRELVVSGSPKAATVLDTLIAYLRTAVPRLHEEGTTIGQEVQLVRAYLELMHLRMPDRLQFDVQADSAALELRCPPTTLLTLVENAIRHGIDPSEEGGRIDVRVELWDGRVRVRVTDTGLGLHRTDGGLGTGLAALRERLELVFGRDVQLRIAPIDPHGVRAEAEFPAVRPS
jgi:LytS/YehU family sensor histidine kinase